MGSAATGVSTPGSFTIYLTPDITNDRDLEKQITNYGKPGICFEGLKASKQSEAELKKKKKQLIDFDVVGVHRFSKWTSGPDISVVVAIQSYNPASESDIIFTGLIHLVAPYKKPKEIKQRAPKKEEEPPDFVTSTIPSRFDYYNAADMLTNMYIGEAKSTYTSKLLTTLFKFLPDNSLNIWVIGAIEGHKTSEMLFDDQVTQIEEFAADHPDKNIVVNQLRAMYGVEYLNGDQGDKSSIYKRSWGFEELGFNDLGQFYGILGVEVRFHHKEVLPRPDLIH